MINTKVKKELLKLGKEAFEKILETRLKELSPKEDYNLEKIIEDYLYLDKDTFESEEDKIRATSVFYGYRLALGRVGLLNKVEKIASKTKKVRLYQWPPVIDETHTIQEIIINESNIF